MATIEVTFPSDGPPGKILKWRVRSDTMVAAGRILLLYQNAMLDADDDAKESERKLRATNFGRVKRLLAKEGDVVQPGYASFPQSLFNNYTGFHSHTPKSAELPTLSILKGDTHIFFVTLR